MFAHRLFPLAAAAILACSPAGATASHKVVNTILDSGNTGQTLSSGYTTMETAGSRCTSSTCTVSMQVMASVGKATCTSEWAIVGLVDGNSVDGGPDQSDLPSNGKYQTRTWQGQYTVSNGNHTFAFQIYVPCSTNAYQWSVNYMLTTP
ncbi:MAG TPA: hypothetical protein VKR31_08625 [Rhizomicrobium sp.]|nr:hypothetical protein [Rhizomicrobium sp.]